MVEGPKAGQTIALEGRPLLMGRAQDADLVLVDDYASGRHARLFPQGTRWFLEDLGSTNGTYVNGAPVTRALPVGCLLYTSPSPRDQRGSRMPSSA